MHRTSSATPLLALDAVALDIEATSLDPLRARILEVAAIRIAGGQPSDAVPFDRHVNPGEPIPAESTAVHGIDDRAVAQAPRFEQVWPDLSHYLASSVIIGHSVGYDLALLRNECRRAGLAWSVPHALDTALLSQALAPTLSGYSLDEVAAWLGVEVGTRHSARGDAMTTVRIFGALLPRLRDRGIRTLGEAENACRQLTQQLDRQQQAGWAEAVAAPDRKSIGVEGEVDTYPYRHRVRDVMTVPPVFMPDTTLLQAALDTMMTRQISSIYVSTEPAGAANPNARPEHTGIVTERDALRAIATHGAAALTQPIARIMKRPLVTIAADAFVYRAIARMNRLKYRHLGVIDEQGIIAGALSARDLLRLRAGESIALDDEIGDAADVATLAHAWAKLPHVAAGLVAEGLSARDIAAVISHQLGELTGHVAALAERRLIAAGHGAAPCPYAVTVLGSAGREESLLAFDQDNALVFAEGEPGGSADRWFERLGIDLADILNEIGVPYCKGGVMARNLQWRGSLATWRNRIADWIARTTPEALLSVDIFFDLRCVHGAHDLADTVRRDAFESAHHEVAFAKLLAESAGGVPSSFNFFGGFRTEEGRLDLKRAGLFGIVTFARVLAVRHDVRARSTPARLAALRARGVGADADLEMLSDAQALFLDLILRQQLDDIGRGISPSNRVLIKQLTRSQKDRLRAALREAQQLEHLTRELLF